MTLYTIRHAAGGDLADVRATLIAANRRVAAKGRFQWDEDGATMSPHAIDKKIRRGEFLIARDGDTPAAVVAVSREGDTDFWTPAELAQPAVYISKLATADGRPGLGSLLLRWVVSRAAASGITLARLDVLKDNPDLWRYYKAQGWEKLRTEDLARRRSGVLFQTATAPDPYASAAFREQGPITFHGKALVMPDDTAATAPASYQGAYRSVYTFHSDSRGSDFTSEHDVTVTQDGNRVTVRSTPTSASTVTMDLTADGRVLTGTWTEETEPGGHYGGIIYSGAIEMIATPDGARLEGQWVGADKNLTTVNNGPWTLTRTGPATNTGTAPQLK